MAYRTKYQLKWIDDIPTLPQVAQALALTAIENTMGMGWSGGEPSQAYKRTERMDEAIRYWTDVLEGTEETPWYDHQADMAHVAALWPEVNFQLYLNGEDSTDLTVEYHKGGLIHYAAGEVFYPKFDPSLMTAPEWNPGAEQKLETFLHLGWLVQAETGGGYYAVPQPPQKQPKSVWRDPAHASPGVLLEASSKAEAISIINSWTDTSENQQKPQRAVPAKQHPGGWGYDLLEPRPATKIIQEALDTISEASKTADPETARILSKWLESARLPGD